MDLEQFISKVENDTPSTVTEILLAPRAKVTEIMQSQGLLPKTCIFFAKKQDYKIEIKWINDNTGELHFDFFQK